MRPEAKAPLVGTHPSSRCTCGSWSPRCSHPTRLPSHVNGGYCGSGDGDDGDAKVEVTVTISVSPADAGTVLVNGTEPKSGVFTAWQGDSLVLEAIPNDGYVFDRWSDWFSESTSSVEAPIYNHKTLTAHFVQDSEEPVDVETTEDSEWLPKGTVALDKRGNTLADISVELRLPRALPSSGVLVSDVYDFKPDGATFDPPIPVSLPYDADSLPAGTDENALAIATFDTALQDWVLLPSEVNVQDSVVVTRVARLQRIRDSRADAATARKRSPGHSRIQFQLAHRSSRHRIPGTGHHGERSGQLRGIQRPGAYTYVRDARRGGRGRDRDSTVAGRRRLREVHGATAEGRNPHCRGQRTQ